MIKWLGFRDLVESTDPGRALEDHFNTKRGVYHNATMNLPCKNSLSEKEFDLIERFAPDFGNSFGFR